jgi:hypothetical protein
MKLVARIAVAFAVLALAAPALACGGDKMKSADKAEAKPVVASTTGEKAQASPKAKAASVKKAEAKPAVAQN